MATYFSINSISVGGIGFIWPGTQFADITDNIAALQAAGVVLKPATDPIIAAAAATAQALRAGGGGVSECESLMQIAVLDSLAAGATTDAAAAAASAAAAATSETNAATSETNAATSETNAGTSETNAAASAAAASTSETNAGTSETNAAASAAAAAASVPVLASATIAVADLSGLGIGVKTFTKNIGGVQPVGQRLAGVVQGDDTFVGFDNGAAATYTIDVGWGAAPDALVAASDVAVATATGFPKAGNGTSHFYGAAVGGLQLQMKITSSADLNTTIAGSVTAETFTFLPS